MFLGDKPEVELYPEGNSGQRDIRPHLHRMWGWTNSIQLNKRILQKRLSSDVEITVLTVLTFSEKQTFRPLYQTITYFTSNKFTQITAQKSKISITVDEKLLYLLERFMQYKLKISTLLQKFRRHEFIKMTISRVKNTNYHHVLN